MLRGGSPARTPFLGIEARGSRLGQCSGMTPGRAGSDLPVGVTNSVEGLAEDSCNEGDNGSHDRRSERHPGNPEEHPTSTPIPAMPATATARRTARSSGPAFRNGLWVGWSLMG